MKRYTCSGCGLKQKVKDRVLMDKVVQEGDRAIKGKFATCVRCKKNVRMIPVNKDIT